MVGVGPVAGLTGLPPCVDGPEEGEETGDEGLEEPESPHRCMFRTAGALCVCHDGRDSRFGVDKERRGSNEIESMARLTWNWFNDR